MAIAQEPAHRSRENLRAVHMMAPGHGDLPVFRKAVDEAMKPLGINVIVLEVNYGFKFQSHPELSEGRGLSRDDARDLADYLSRPGNPA